MLEVVVAWLVDQKGLSRRAATIAVFVCALALGSACAISSRVFSACDFLTSNVLMMTGAFVFAIIVGWKMPKADVRTQFTNYGTSRAARATFPVVWFLIRWVVPVMIVAIAFTNLF